MNGESLVVETKKETVAQLKEHQDKINSLILRAIERADKATDRAKRMEDIQEISVLAQIHRAASSYRIGILEPVKVDTEQK